MSVTDLAVAFISDVNIEDFHAIERIHNHLSLVGILTERKVADDGVKRRPWQRLRDECEAYEMSIDLGRSRW